MDFREWKFINFDQNFIEVCSKGTNQQYSSNGSENDFAPTRRQAIISANGG